MNSTENNNPQQQTASESNAAATASAECLPFVSDDGMAPKEYLYIPLWKVFFMLFCPFYIYLWMARNWRIYQQRMAKPFATNFGRWVWRQRRTLFFMFSGGGLIKEFMPKGRQSLIPAVGLVLMVWCAGIIYYQALHVKSVLVYAVVYIALLLFNACWYTNLQRIINKRVTGLKEQPQPRCYALQAWNPRAFVAAGLGILFAIGMAWFNIASHHIIYNRHIIHDLHMRLQQTHAQPQGLEGAKLKLENAQLNLEIAQIKLMSAQHKQALATKTAKQHSLMTVSAKK